MNPAQTDPMIGRLIDGRYQVRSRIARGGMATVYLATDLRLERRVAIKIMHGHLADDTSFKNRFVQEARSAARLAHPNVVNVFDQGQDSDMAYLVMEYLPGITLRDLLKDYGKLTPEQTIDVMEAVLAGLAAAHRAGIVHRDLKPENVLLADDGRIKIGDFGLARAASANTTTGQALLGTIAYLSPELVTRGIADARSDIYALGIMMYEMLTGEQPFQGEQPMQIAYQHANDAVPAPSSKTAEVPEQLDELVLWATAKEPDHRPADAGVMLERLIEVEKVMRGEQDASALAPAIAPTMALEPSYEGSDDDTAILDPATRQRVPATAPTAVDTLTRTAGHRRVRGWWVFVLVLLLGGFAGGTGWYFGSGPGSMVRVPHLASRAPASATATLQELGLEVTRKQVYSLTVPADHLTGTEPHGGTFVHKGSTVTIDVSQGPRPITVPVLAGLPQDAAIDAITGLDAAVGNIDTQFDPTVPSGDVISAATKDGTDLSQGGPSFEGDTVNLLVSLGPVPDVAGKTVDAATAALQEAGLTPEKGAQSYSDTVAEGVVISAAPAKDGAVHKGDTILLTVSKGPAPVPVPSVVGKTWDAAKKSLAAAGFKLDYPAIADGAPGIFTVASTDPTGGTPAAKGSTVKVTFANPFGG